MAKETGKGKEIVAENEFLSLNKLWVGLKVAIKENAIQCSMRSNISQCFVSKLEEGRIFSLYNFTVIANKDKYWVRNGDAYILSLKATQLQSLRSNHDNQYGPLPVAGLDLVLSPSQWSSHPLMDNLEAQIYETFEKDTTKYIQYEKAICKALIDRVPDEAASHVSTLII
ncbi:hypothetical protein V2J09_012898 [Rumex salicifolius]